MGKFLKVNESRDIYFLVVLRFQKTILHNKVTNKTQTTKNQEHFAHRFGDNYLISHLVKFQQDLIEQWRARALRVSTGYQNF